MTSTLGYALLALLANGPRTGYGLRTAMREPVGFFWTASHSQIYPELAVLEDGGLVRHRVIEGRGPRDTKEYRLTAAGRRALADWAVTPPGDAPERDELMVKVFALWTAPVEQARALIEMQRAHHRRRLARYEQIEKEFVDGDAAVRAAVDDPATPQFAGFATLQCGLSYERHRIRWCTWLLGRLDQGRR
jgi:DNA-binding PadR family transcriptional regulator